MLRRMRARPLTRLALLAAVGACVAAFVAPIAITEAHDSQTVTHPGGGRGKVYGHHNIHVCDTRADGHEVWVGYYDSGRKTYQQSGRANVSGGSCSWTYIAWNITKFRVCISYEGCTEFHSHNSSNWRPR